MRRAATRRGRPNLTSRDLLRVLPAIADGATVDQAARQLHMSPDAVRMRLHRLRTDLGARNTTHLVAIAYREGLLSGEVSDA